MPRWDELNILFKNAGAVIIFGLNALQGRTIDSHGVAVGNWNSSNAESFIRYTVNKGYTIHGWELGNELCGSGVGTRVTADQYASDMKSLQNKVHQIYSGSELAMPLVLAPGGFFDSKWFSDFVAKAPQSVQVLTHHIYNLGPGSATDLVDKILNPSVLDGISKTFRDLQMLLKHSNIPAVAWVGESGGAYNSGRNLVTNAFVFSFWYLDQLGMSASYDTKTYCRQTLIGGNYGLLDINSFKPNPDYYSALLWHRLMGNNVLSASFSGTKKLRTYAHCSKKTQGITVLLINLGNTTVQVDVSTETGGSRDTLNLEEGLKDFKATKNDAREEYHLTAKNGDLHSRVMLLNGKELTVNAAGQIPSLEPMIVGISNPISVAPFSIVFVHIPNISTPACK
ncbi:heparanase-like protein 3 isoform X2 [Argentina anserina]|nr:heparanase-like protein 3 isoform X2 [Potentilla anserina]